MQRVIGWVRDWFERRRISARLRRDIARARRGVRPSHWPVTKLYRARIVVEPTARVFVADAEMPWREPEFTMERVWPMPWGPDTQPVEARRG